MSALRTLFVVLITLCSMQSRSQIPHTSTDVEKSAFFSALYSMSPSLSSDTFMMEQLLKIKCGVSPSIKKLKAAVDSNAVIKSALKNGDHARAQSIIDSIQCERSVRD